MDFSERNMVWFWCDLGFQLSTVLGLLHHIFIHRGSRCFQLVNSTCIGTSLQYSPLLNHQRCRLFNWALITTPSSFIQRMQCPCFRSILNDLWLKEDSCVSESCSYTASWASTCICGWHSELCSQMVISGSVLEPTQWFPQQNYACF